MTDREQLENVCRWNRELVRENSRLHLKQSQLREECDELNSANASLQAQLEAADAFLGAAMDQALGARRA